MRHSLTFSGALAQSVLGAFLLAGCGSGTPSYVSGFRGDETPTVPGNVPTPGQVPPPPGGASPNMPPNITPPTPTTTTGIQLPPAPGAGAPASPGGRVPGDSYYRDCRRLPIFRSVSVRGPLDAGLQQFSGPPAAVSGAAANLDRPQDETLRLGFQIFYGTVSARLNFGSDVSVRAELHNASGHLVRVLEVGDQTFTTGWYSIWLVNISRSSYPTGFIELDMKGFEGDGCLAKVWGRGNNTSERKVTLAATVRRGVTHALAQIHPLACPSRVGTLLNPPVAEIDPVHEEVTNRRPGYLINVFPGPPTEMRLQGDRGIGLVSLTLLGPENDGYGNLRVRPFTIPRCAAATIR